jgi:hypothetical protein
MSTTGMLTGNNLTQKNWSKARYDWMQMSQETVFGHLFNRGAIYVPPEMSGKSKNTVKGDQLTFSYVGKATGKATGEGGTMAGNESAVDLQSQQCVWNVTRYAFKSPNDDGTIESQRTNVAFEEASRTLIRERFGEWIDTACFYHLAGASPSTLTIDGTTYSTAAELLHVQGHNAPTQPTTTDRIIRVAGAATDQALTSADTLTLLQVDYMLEKAGNSNQTLKYLPGRELDLFVSHEQLVDLQHDTTSAIQWYTQGIAQIQGGMANNKVENRFDNNMVCAGKYRNVNIYAHPRVAYGENSSSGAVITTVRRAVLVGKDALIWMSPFGGAPGDKDVPLRYFTEFQDYEYYKGIEGRLIWGLDKNTPSGKEDVGVIVCSSYAATHA